MGKRGVGALLCLTAGILFSARYISAAIFLSGISSWNSELFQAGLEYVGPWLTILGVICLIVGIIYLIAAEISEKKKNQGE